MMVAMMIKPSHKGRLHKALDVSEGKPIPDAKIAAAKHSSSPALRKEATFAQNAKHFNHQHGPIARQSHGGFGRVHKGK